MGEIPSAYNTTKGGPHRQCANPGRATAGIRGRLEALVAAESECCPFLIFNLNLAAADPRLVLEVTGPEQAAPIIDELFA